MSRIIEAGEYRISYGGGRLAGVLLNGIAVECVQVRRYNFATGEFGPEPTDDEIRERVAEFLNPEDMGNYQELADFYDRQRQEVSARLELVKQLRRTAAKLSKAATLLERGM